jgi:hypothetical protein
MIEIYWRSLYSDSSMKLRLWSFASVPSLGTLQQVVVLDPSPPKG